MDQVNDSKLSATQNIIRKKFEKAYTNRIEHEQDVNRVMNRLTTSPLSTKTDESESENKDFSLRDLSKTTINTPQLRLSNKSYSNDAVKINKEIHRDPNALCDNLRLLLEELRDLDIIV